MLPPILEFPPEILAEIFVKCLPERDSERLHPNNAPGVFCRVNSTWRQAALGEPLLWDTVVFPAIFHDNQQLPPNTRISHSSCTRFINSGSIDLWFSRTGTTHLLSFGEEGSPTSRLTHNFITYFLPTLYKYSRRFRRLSVNITKIRQFELFRRGFPDGIYDELVSVSICCPLEMTPRQLEAFPRLGTPFNSATKLRDVTLTLAEAKPDKFVLPWAQLTTITLDHIGTRMNGEQWTLLFKQSPNLQHATLLEPDPWVLFVEHETLLVHPSLTSLTFIVADSPDDSSDDDYPLGFKRWQTLTKPVDFPNLRDLQLQVNFTPTRASSPLDFGTDELRRIQNLTISTRNGSSSMVVPSDISGMIKGLAANPNSLPSLRRLAVPCHNSALPDIARLLDSRPPTNAHPGLTVVAHVFLGLGERTYHSLPDRCPELQIGDRFCLRSLHVLESGGIWRNSNMF